MDGIDVKSISYVTPVAIREQSIAKETYAPVPGAGPLGVLAFSTLAS